MKRLSLFAWALIGYFSFVLAVVATNSEVGDEIGLRVSFRDDILQGAPSCQLSFSRVELLNLVGFVACDIFRPLILRVSTQFDVAPTHFTPKPGPSIVVTLNQPSCPSSFS
eukprot:scaffold1736_cov127-Cylindrotheca_fusiformis.AAC.119